MHAGFRKEESSLGYPFPVRHEGSTTHGMEWQSGSLSGEPECADRSLRRTGHDNDGPKQVAGLSAAEADENLGTTAPHGRDQHDRTATRTHLGLTVIGTKRHGDVGKPTFDHLTLGRTH